MMRELAERAWFAGAGAFGRLLRAGRYSTTHSAGDDVASHVRKHRRFYAPLLIRLGGALVRLLDTGMRVLPQHEWLERERLLYRSLYGTSVSVAGDGALVLPFLHGRTLANLLEDATLTTSGRHTAIRLAVVALAALHRAGFTHGDAMAENVMIDVDADVACWFDFETVHDTTRAPAWRRADDVRALLSTCLLRTPRTEFAAVTGLIVDIYADHEATSRPAMDVCADHEATSRLAAAFASVWRRTLPFHLGQAGLSFRDHREIARLLRERRGGGPRGR